MTLVITGIVVWLIAVVFILRFFSVCKEIKRRPKKREFTVHQKQLLNITSGRDQNQDLTESELESLKENNDK